MPDSPIRVTVVTAAAAAALTWTQRVRDLLAPIEPNGSRVEPSVAFQALRGVLHALRLSLPASTSAALSASLPTLLRGVYHEPLAHPRPADTRDGFLGAVDRATRHAVRPEEAVRSVLCVAEAALPLGVWCELRASLPAEIEHLLAVPPYGASGVPPAPQGTRYLS